MREILFRGFHPDENGKEKVFVNGKWINGFWLFGYYVDEKSVGTDFPCIVPIKGGTRTLSWKVIPETIGQYTGLCNKSGTKIFEGDIVIDCTVYNCHEQYVKMGLETEQDIEKYRTVGEVGVVKFCVDGIGSCGCCYPSFVGTGFKADEINLTECEVIGNIYENPELLEEYL